MSDCVLRCGGRGSKSDFEVCVLWVGRSFFDFGLYHVAGKSLLYVAYAAIYIFAPALGEHLDGAVRQVADEACNLVAIGHPVGGEAETNTLDMAGEDYMPGSHS